MERNRAQLRGGPAGQLLGARRRHWDNWKDGASQPRFPRAKESLRKLSVIWALTLEEILSSCPKPKKLKENQFEEAPNY
jgi:hypothetical protein